MEKILSSLHKNSYNSDLLKCDECGNFGSNIYGNEDYVKSLFEKYNVKNCEMRICYNSDCKNFKCYCENCVKDKFYSLCGDLYCKDCILEFKEEYEN